MTHDTSFWQAMARFIEGSTVTIDGPKRNHPRRYTDLIYTPDYGYLENTTASDGGRIDVWLGPLETRTLTGILFMFDTLKREMKIKFLLACIGKDVLNYSAAPK